MGIGPQNLGAAGMSTKSKPCGTPLKMAEDSPLAKALIGNQDRLPEQLKQKILDAPEDAKKVANSGCNGVIVGSTFVKYIQDNLSAPDLTQSFGKQVKSFSEVLK